MKVSLVITVLNEVEAISSTLETLLQQTRRPDEIVIVDGGSTDGTLEKLKEFSRIEKTISLIESPGVNIAKGRNIAIREAENPIIVTTDVGCRPDTTWLERMVAPFEEYDASDVVKGVVVADPKNTFESLAGLYLAGVQQDIDDESYPLSGRSSGYTKAIWEKAGGYPEWLYTAEDTLFHRKLKKIKANIKLVRNANVFWRPRTNLSKFWKMWYLYGRGNGRIGDEVSGAYYHLRNYLILLLLLVGGFFYPLLLVPGFFFIFYFYWQFYRPTINKMKRAYTPWKVELFSPIIITIHNLAYYVGLIVGNYEYRSEDNFSERLEKYLNAS